MKITPAHDFNDFEVGKRHGLPLINILDAEAQLRLDGNEAFLDGLPRRPISTPSWRSHGLDRFEARKRVVAMLEERGDARHRSSRTRTRCRTATARAS